MPERKKLSDSEILEGLSELNSWTVENHKLHKTYEFADFTEAFAFMTKSAMAAEKLNHHPEWYNVYNKVTVDLTTHDLGGISTYDFELAKIMDSFAE